MLDYINGWELFPIVLFSFIGFLMIVYFKNVKMTFLGVFILVMITYILYSTHSHYQAKVFVLQRFNEGHAIECGLWRGESALIDSHNGWKHVPNLGFVKGDQIHNDLGLCSVIAQKEPKPSVVPYLFFLLIELMVIFGLRIPIQNEYRTDTDRKELNEFVGDYRDHNTL